YPAGYSNGSVKSVLGRRSEIEMDRSYRPPRYAIPAAARGARRVSDQFIQNDASSHSRKKISSDTTSTADSASLRMGRRKALTSASIFFKVEFTSDKQTAPAFGIGSLPSCAAARCP